MNLTAANIQDLAGTVKLVNGLQNPTVAAKMGEADFVVDNTASSPTLIYNANNFWQTSFAQLLGTFVHEFAHLQNPGPSGEDAALLKALKISNPTNTNAISVKLAGNCFSAVKDPKK